MTLEVPVLDTASVKKQFPLLADTIDGAPIHYLDSANSSQKPQCVIDAMSSFNEHHYAPINRSAYRLAAEATDAYEGRAPRSPASSTPTIPTRSSSPRTPRRR